MINHALKPLITEKTLQLSAEGKYTFEVSRKISKNEARKLIEKVFSVHVVSIKTINKKGELKKNFRGKSKEIKPVKKVIVSLKEKEKIDLFETKK